jgi:hypothetical protein
MGTHQDLSPRLYNRKRQTHYHTKYPARAMSGDRWTGWRRQHWRGLAAGALTVLLLAAVPAAAGPPFRTDDPEPVEFQNLEINLHALGTKAEMGSSGVLPGLEVNYGAMPDLQLHAIVPMNYTAPVDGRTGFAMGDIELGAKFRFITPGEDDWFPQVAVYPLIAVPSGNQNLGFSTGHTQVFLPLWLQKDFKPWTAYGGGGYWINPGVGRRNYVFFGAALWREVTENLKVGVEVFHQTSPDEIEKDSTGFNVGAIYGFADSWRVMSSVGMGLQNVSETNQLSWYLGLQRNF